MKTDVDHPLCKFGKQRGGEEGVRGRGQEPLSQDPELQRRTASPGSAALAVALGKSLSFPGLGFLLFQETKWVK